MICYDKEQAQKAYEDFVKPPLLGDAYALSKAGEKGFQHLSKGLYYEDVDKKSHCLKHILRVHCKVSEEGELDEEASVELLKRLLRGKSFNTAENLSKSGPNIARLYKYLQRTFKDEPDPYDAEKQLGELIDKPGDLNLDQLLQKVLDLSYNKHKYEPKTMMESSVNATATSYAMQYLTKNYPRTVVERIRGLHINWCSRTMAQASTEAYYELMDIAVKNLAGYRPNHLARPWQQQAPQAPQRPLVELDPQVNLP